jgi:8-oxo-dGTP pyrophosphatase MutT (NUDIX family)
MDLGSVGVDVRPAATILVLHDHTTTPFESEIRVLMMQRSMTASFLPGAYVFPGGVVDLEDGSPECISAIEGLTDEAASRMLGMANQADASTVGAHIPALAFWIAAVRECFEESGLLLAVDQDGNHLSIASAHDERLASQLAADRASLLAGSIGFGAVLQRYSATVRADEIVPWSRWITPIGGKRRFDTRFFVTSSPQVAAVPSGGSGGGLSFDEREMSDLQWFTPAEAIADERVVLITPTVSALRLLGRHRTSQDVLDGARQRTSIWGRPFGLTRSPLDRP